MSRTTEEDVFIPLKVIKRYEEKRPQDRRELTKLKTRNCPGWEFSLMEIIRMGIVQVAFARI